MALNDGSYTIQNEASLLSEIARKIVEVADPEQIILFGSSATEGLRPGSDIDLLVLKRQFTDRRGEYLAIRRALSDIPAPLDIVLMTSDWYEETKDVVGGLAYPAARHGRVLHAA